jgi:hypothetical protein
LWCGWGCYVLLRGVGRVLCDGGEGEFESLVGLQAGLAGVGE